ncbi:MAG: filamentous hemagglutinin family protein [Gammaproteobacteria bacterium]|nr:filamentous hemagglutinin family protein [Gammaproteobacteria bacterium]
MNSNPKQRQIQQADLRLKTIPAACRRALATWPRIQRRRITFATSILFGALSCNMAMADLPKICTGGIGCGGSNWYNPATTSMANPSGFVNTGNVDTAHRQIWQVDQLSQNALLNWESFNVDANVHLNFHNATYGANSSTLNRIFQANPSNIYGSISADGRLYLINQNGIIFRNGSQVDTHGLIASTLNIDDQTYLKGLLTAFNAVTPGPAFSAFVQNGVNVSKDITVEAGATINATDHGTVALFGRNVNQGGAIRTADGQVILAAGSKIYIAGSADPGLRGWVVEVDSDVKDTDLNNYKTNPQASLSAATVTNTGLVDALRGNVSMVGLAINQQGIVHATTAVGENGSIVLKARDRVLPEQFNPNRFNPTNARDGRATFGTGSSTVVDNDVANATLTATAAQQPLPSTIAVAARQIHLETGSELRAVGGQIELRAEDTSKILQNPVRGGLTKSFTDVLLGYTDPRNPDLLVTDARIQVDSGSSLNVSGDAVVLPMSSNQLTVKLTSNELNGEPNQINGILRGQNVNVDIRNVDQNGRIPIADISAAVANTPTTVNQHTTPGGTVTLNSQGSVVFSKGAKIDVSGGSITYTDGYIATTKLTANGNVYDIATADPSLVYDGIVGKVIQQSSRWGVTRTWSIGGLSDLATFYHGYVAGQDAGTVNIAARSMVLNGDLVGHTVNGANQRQADQQAKGAQLILGLPGGIGDDTNKSYRAPNVNISATDAGDFNLGNVDLFTQLDQELQQQVYLSTRAFTQGGFNRLAVYSNGVISNQQMVLNQTAATQPLFSLGQGAALRLAPGGSVNLNAEQVRLYGDVSTPGGAISINTLQLGVGQSVSKPISAANTGGSAPSTITVDTDVTGNRQLLIGDDVHLSVAGQWVNDHIGVADPIPTDGIFVNGGTIALNAGKADSLYLGNHAVMDVQGGAWLSSSNTLSAGKGGTITLAMGVPDSNANPTPKTILGGNLQLLGYGLQQGGTLNVTMTGFALGHDPTAWNPRQMVTAHYAAGAVTALRMPTQLLFDNGFAHVHLNSTLGNIEIQNGTTLQAQQRNRVLDSGFAMQASGAVMTGFSHIDTLDPSLRKPVDIEFTTNFGDIRLDSGATIIADPASAISMNATGGMIDIEGGILAPGGNIALTQKHTDWFYNPDLQIMLGKQAELSTAGTYIAQPNTQDQQRGQIYDGGTVSLTSDGFINVQAGAVIDVSGTAAQVDLPNAHGGMTRTAFASNAGTMNFTTNQGMALNGRLMAFAGGAQQRGGSINFLINQETGAGSPSGSGASTQDVDKYNSYNPYLHPELALGRTLDVVQSAGSQTLRSGVVTVDVDQIQHSGFDQLNLQTQITPSIYATPADKNIATPDIHFNGNVAINLRQAVTLNSSRITTTGNAVTTINAPYIRLGASDATSTLDPATAHTPTASATITADLIDLVGHSSWQGFGQLNVHSRGDIRFTNPNLSNYSTPGELATTAPLSLIAAQIYPTTLYDFQLSSTFQPTASQPDSIYIGHNPGMSPAVPLSVGGRVSLNGTALTIDGILRAPLGELNVGAAATQRVTVTGNGMLGTSLQGANLLFGRVSNAQWYYQLQGAFGNPLSTDSLAALPQQQITLKADNVNLQTGSIVDVKGGGDLLAWDYLPVGRLYDPLSAANAGHYFAILPSQVGRYAAYDPQEFAGTSIQPGDSVYLSGGGGVAAGTYAILPARYALLPGAMLVQTLPAQRDQPLGTTGRLPDGTPIVAGYRTELNTDYVESQTRSFALHPGSYAYRMAEFSLTRASEYLRAQGTEQRTPLDAGTLTFTPQSTLELNGRLDFAPANGGRGVEVNIDSAHLQVVAQRGPDSTGQVQLVASELNGLNAESILLGGTRTHGGTNAFQINTNTLSLADGVVLQGPEWILGAQQNLTIGNQVTINATGGNTATQAGIWHSDANSAFIRLSSGDQISLQREGQQGGAPQIAIGAGSRLQADRSILVDTGASSSGVDLTDKLQFNTTTTSLSRSLTLSSDQLHLNNPSTALAGLRVSTANLNAASITNLVLQGRRVIDVAADLTQGLDANGQRTSELHADQFQIDTANLQGMAGLGDILTFSAGQLSMLNSGTNASGNLVAGAGTVRLQAGTSLRLGQSAQTDTPSTLRVEGFDQVQLSVAQGDITGAGTTTLESSGNLTLTGARLTAQSGSDLTINARGKQVTVVGTAATATLPTDQLGARLAVNAQTIAVAGAIELHSGVVDLHASGANGVDAVNVTGAIDVSGGNKSFAEVITGTAGGTVKLTADAGNVAMQSTASIDVSGASAGGDAGLLSIAAVQGNTQLQGQLQGKATTGAQSGRFRLDTLSLSQNASDLNNRLNAGGFHDERSLHLHGPGDITLSALDTLQANRINFVADQGAIQIAATLDAAGANGGAIALSARGDVTLASTGSLDAHATVAGGNGGTLAINTTAGGVYLDGSVNVARAAADPSSGEQGQAGKVKLRLSQSAMITLTDADTTNDKLRINAPGLKADYLQMEALASPYTITSITATDIANIKTAATTFMTTNATAINTALSNLNTLPGLVTELRAGVEIQSGSDLNLATPWDLAALSANGQPIDLTLRAAGHLNLNANLSDGFNAAGALSTKTSADLTLTAGADLRSVDTSAVHHGVGNVVIGAGATVRSGSGDITVSAGNNIELSNSASTIYTAGRLSGNELDAWQGGNAVKALPVGGGNLALIAGGDIVAADGPSQLFTDWLVSQTAIKQVIRGTRITTHGENAGWYIDFKNFQQNFAVFGGGNLSAEAGGAITRASFSVPTTGYYDSMGQKEVHIGSGNLTVHADGNINSALFFVGDGRGDITTDQSLTATGRSLGGNSLGNVFAEMGGSLTAVARGSVASAMLINPTLISTLSVNPYFFSYGDRSALNLVSVGKNIVFTSPPFTAEALPFFNATTRQLTGNGNDVYTQNLPPTLSLIADSGDVTIAGDIYLYPSAFGNFTVLANAAITDLNFIKMYDIAVAQTQTLATVVNRTVTDAVLPPEYTLSTTTPLHANDPAPLTLISNQGDIVLDNLSSPKSVNINAGRDLIITGNIRVTHSHEQQDDLSVFSARRDILLTRDSTNYININGPGQLYLAAGRDIDLGKSNGIQTSGNLNNPQLAANGANITVMAGLAGMPPQYSQFMQNYPGYLSPDTAAQDRFMGEVAQTAGHAQASFSDAMQTYLTILTPQQQFAVRNAGGLTGKDIFNLEAVQQFQWQLTQYLRDLLPNQSNLSTAQALALFPTLSLQQQRPMIQQMFFSELRTAGRSAKLADASAADRNYTDGYRALDVLFPDINPANSAYHGDIKLFFSQIKTLAGGDITLLAPGGIVNAGLAVQPPGADNKTPDQLGIVALREGNIRIFSQGDIQVNQSRIFTLGGGDLLLWSSYGDIDAGRGSKSAISAPPPTLNIDSQGNVILNFAGAVSGSGIRVICVVDCKDNGQFISTIKARGPGIKISAADVDLIAPHGTVSAGEAGIGSAGNLFIAAQQVLGTDNIDIGGVAFGVPTTTPTVTPPTVSSPETTGIKTGGIQPTEYQPLGAGNTLMYLDVEVIGFGDQEDDQKRKKKH